MKPFIENFFKVFVRNGEDIFGDQSEFIEFDQTNAENNSKGMQSDTIFGCIRYKTKNSEILLSPPLTAKCPSTMNPVAEALLFQFTNEIFVYGHILPYFAHLEPSVLELFPKFYGSSTQTHPGSSEAVLLLENLEHSSYQNAPCKSFLDYAHLSLMVRSLGRFHAFSYLAKMQDPMPFQAHALALNPICVATVGKCEVTSTIYGIRGLTHLAHKGVHKSFVPHIQQLLKKANHLLVTMFKNERNNPWAVVCHGDYLAGNVMFKYDKGEPVHLKMFDLSSSTFSSPVLDLALVLYINANQETRDLYWDQLIDDYCLGLSSLPIPEEKLPSRDIIMKELQSKAFYAYIIASFFLPVIVSQDLKLGSFHQFLPPQHKDCKHFLDLPLEVRIDIVSKMGGEIVTQHLANILEDMLKRGFIQKSSLVNGMSKVDQENTQNGNTFSENSSSYPLNGHS